MADDLPRNEPWYRMTRREALYVAVLIGIGLSFFAYKVSIGTLDYSSDYESYHDAALVLGGEGQSAATDAPHRLLKPFEPALNAALAPAFGYEGAFDLIVALFFILLVPTAYFLFRALFRLLGVSSADPPLQALAVFTLTYPMFRYALDAYTETGALFFYALGLIGVLFFIRQPSWKAVLFNLAIAVLGFFWKEYSILPVIMWNAVALFHPALKGRGKLKLAYLAALDIPFVLVNLAWQAYVFIHFHYNYLDWYSQGGASGFGAFGPIDIVKSLFALLMIGWIFVPFAFGRLRSVGPEGKAALIWCGLVPLLCFAWGAVSSRLFYVLMPVLAVLSVIGIGQVFASRRGQWLAVASIVLAQALWLFHSSL